MGEYFNGTDAVDDDDPRDQSWNAAFETARKFFPLKDDEVDLVMCAIQACRDSAELRQLPRGGYAIMDGETQLGTGRTAPEAWIDAARKANVQHQLSRRDGAAPASERSESRRRDGPERLAACAGSASFVQV